ncbi:sensor histidine kinase [Dactylosporangium sp. NPDC049525]|uniref:sensor histidine kinase n=1 Tax=Dactylosporangium sp. NPDC049525 TaxID=3154730 RepID=UPI003443B8B3
MKRWQWDLGFTVVAGAVIAFMAFDDGPGPRAAFVSSLLVAAALAWYFLYGRRHIFRTVTPRGAWIFVSVLAVLHLAAVWIDHTASFALFAWGTMIFASVPRRPSVAIVAALTLLPVPMTYLRDGTLSLVHGLLPLTALGLAFALLLGTFVSHLVEQNEERAAMIAELSASRAEVARLSHEAGVATERARLAAEIHDTLAQGFTSIITLAQAAESATDPDTVRRRLTQVAGTARENLAEARALVAALSPADLHTSGLGDAVRRQLSRLASQTGIRTACHLDRHFDPGPADLPTALQVVLLRSLQEALTNVRRHARATSVEVRLALTGTTVVLTVTDDGVGFTTTAPGSGFGLAGMRSRVEQAGGVCTVDSHPGTGTTVKVELS